MRLVTQVLTYIFSLLILVSPVAAQDADKQELIDFNLHYAGGTVTLTSIDRRQGFLPNISPNDESTYSLKIYADSGKELNSTLFNFPLQITNRTGDTLVLQEADKTVTTPFFQDAKNFKVTDPKGTVVLEESLSFVVNPENPEPITDKKALSGLPLYIFGTLALLLTLALVFAGYKFVKNLRTPQTPPTSVN